MKNAEPILARLNSATPLMDGETIRDDIQWMPPGKHTITASKGGEPVTLNVQATALGAAAVQAAFNRIRSEGALRPFFDFDHENAAASAHPAEFYWGGEDPKAGGIRAKLRWSGSGEAAVRARDYQGFSPSFFVDENGEVTGAPRNMGGLVNDPAFKAIDPIWSKAGSADAEPADDRNQNQNMNPPDAAALQAKNSELEKQILELNAKLAAAQNTETIKAKDAEITTLKARITTLEGEVTEGKKISAKAKVDEAIKCGKLAPQATAVHAKWIESLTQDPSRAELLDALKPDPILAGQVTKDTPSHEQVAAADTAQGFADAIKAKVTAGQTKSQAMDLVMAEQPKAYAAWRAANGKPGI